MFTYFSLLENRDGHIAGLIEGKPEKLGKICPNTKDVPFYALQFYIHTNFLLVQLLRRYDFLKNNVCSLFFLHENRDSHIAGLMEGKPEKLGKICPNRKDVPFYVLQFCIRANVLLVQPLRRYEFLKK